MTKKSDLGPRCIILYILNKAIILNILQLFMDIILLTIFSHIKG